jgi:hypothetical protein
MVPGDKETNFRNLVGDLPKITAEKSGICAEKLEHVSTLERSVG